MYPPSSPPRDLEIMLGESLAHHIESNLDNVENNKPQALTSHNAGANLSKTRQTLLKKGGRKVRSSSSSGLQRPQHHQCQQPHQKVLLRNNPTRLADINNNNVSVSVKSQAQFNAELANGRTQSTVLTLHHKQGTKKELLKSKGGRVERCTNQSGSQPVHSLIKHDQPVPNLNTRSHRAKHSHASAATQSTKKPDNINQKKAVSPFQQHLRDVKPFDSPDNIKVVSAVSALLASEEELRDGIGHACGHNLIAEVGAASAIGLKAVIEGTSDFPAHFQVTVIGTPAEEDAGGKADMMKQGAFDGLDVVFMAHPSQEDAPYLPDVAEHDVVVKYHGKASHAASHPWAGVNALDAAVLAYNNISVLRQQLKPDWRVHGVIKHGGLKPNIIPDYTELEYYLRTPSRKDLPTIKAKAERCFRSAAIATGCEVDVEFARNAFDNILRNTTLEDLYETNGKALGMEFTTDEEVLKNSSGSTDFGNVSFIIPGIHPYFYIGTDALNHTEQYTVASGDEKAQFYALRAAKALAMTALDVLLCPELLRRVKDTFTEGRLKEEQILRGSLPCEGATP